ncbi:hypothetical protein C9374_000403 [Naegleria lovaniensis]|uniref:hydroxyacylglutathione hydrolase n=1 Tax=Naegleria lovaniensis TaxID=51637 RepID=A0AA88KNP6_NAELO|nr:uncharacterized protein C9374_000403 [Naegleria lovaniensis]KAG2388239.1 hypothetical protein C9374_000403 [Naegleria lovaniensis]
MLKTKTIRLNSILSLQLLPFFSDNYCYALINHRTKQFALVDPADPAKIQQYLSDVQNQFQDKKLIAILCTHKHYDHAGGNSYFQKIDPLIEIYGGTESEAVNKVIPTEERKGFEFKLFDDQTQIQAYHTPCHTKGHVCYVLQNKKENGDEWNCVFSGDTIFAAGCGKFFEGSAQDMYSNIQLIRSLFSDVNEAKRTLLCCGHEYTVKNVQFLVDRISNVPLVTQYLEKFKNLSNNGEFCVPTTIWEEFELNPYFRAIDDENCELNSAQEKSNYFRKMSEYLGEQDVTTSNAAVDLLKKVRELKDQY